MHKGNKPHDGANEPRTKPVNVLFTPSELVELDEWVYQNRYRTRNEAIRAIIAASVKRGE